MHLRSFAHLFVRRRQVWLPTVWGWLGLIATAVLLTLAAGRFANRWLAIDEPARGPDGHGARTLVVEGWLEPGELDLAIRAFRQGRYVRLLTTGGPVYEWTESHPLGNYADRAADYLKNHGLPAAQVTAVPAPASAQDRTFLSAVMVREWAGRSKTKLEAIDVFTGGAHARRSRMLYRMAFGSGVEIGAIGAESSPVLDRWWTTSVGVKSMIGESLSLAWTVCCFWPPAPGSSQERWAIPAPLPSAASGP